MGGVFAAYNDRSMALTRNDIGIIRTVVIDAIETLVVPRLDVLDNRLDRLEGRVDRLEGRFDKIEYEVQTGFAQIDRRLYKLEGRVQAVENDVKELYKLVPAG